MGLKASVKVNIDAAKVAGLLAKIGQAVYNGVADGADLIKEDAQAIVPIDTGMLHDSITVEMQSGITQMMSGGALKSGAFTVSAAVGPHTDYAAYVEYGTGRRGAESPGAGPGPYKESWPGMVAQPYMRPAYDQDKDLVIDFVRTAVEGVVK